MNSLLIGSGQLGSRHLQAMAAVKHAGTVYVIEPSAENRALATHRWQEIPAHSNKNLLFTDFETLGQQTAANITGAVIATLSIGRLDILRQVLALGIKYIVCEKILFQSIALYEEALHLLTEHRAQAYVNHIYRYVPIYRYIQKLTLHSSDALRMHIDAGNNGLGCNLIHFLDLFQFITGTPPSSLEINIHTPVYANKRGSGLIEFSGTARAHTAGGHTLEVVFEQGETRSPVISVMHGSLSITIDEARGIINPSRNIPCNINTVSPRVSELTTQIMSHLYADKAILLPTIEESFAVNRLMLDAFNAQLSSTPIDNHTICPIT